MNQSTTLELSGEIGQTTVARDGCVRQGSGIVVREHFLEVYINEKLVAKLICTPEHLVELVVGRLISDGYIQDTGEVELLYICNHASKAKVFLYGEADLRQTVNTEPTCCTGNQVFMKLFQEREPVTLKSASWDPEWIFYMADKFVAGDKIHNATRGTHSCYLGVNGELVYSCEDIGRHNALDKAIGYAALNGYDKRQCILFTTGRVPTDMVKKAIFSQIPVLVSKSSPTDAAVELARRYNLTLICNAWPDQYEIFNGPQPAPGGE